MKVLQANYKVIVRDKPVFINANDYGSETAKLKFFEWTSLVTLVQLVGIYIVHACFPVHHR